MAAPQIPEYTGITPNRNQSANDFADNADNWLSYQEPLPADYNALSAYLNNLSIVVNFLTAIDFLTSTDPAVAGEVVDFKGFYSAGDGGYGQWKATGNTIAASQTPAMTGTATMSNALGDEYGLVATVGTLVPEKNIRQLGAKIDAEAAGTDDTAVINAAINSGGKTYLSTGNIRLNGEIDLKSNIELFGIRGATQLWQYGQYLFKQTIADLENVHLHGFTMDFRSASTSRYDCAFSLGAYKKCLFENFDFVRYDDQTILERAPISTATTNGIDNVHRNWNVSACAHLDIAVGLEGYYYKHTGNGVDTVLTTDVIWPEQFNSSVVVMKENQNRIFSQLILTTDYTVSYDGSNKLIITLVVAATSSERIHIWPAQPRTDGNRRPYSNNLWENINCDYLFIRGHTAVRWVDAEDYVYERMSAAANFVKLYDLNPFDERNGQGGDFMNWNGCVLTYRSELVGSPATLTGISMGVGSVYNTSVGLRGDLLWRHGTDNRLIQYNDKETVSLTGTVTTNGTAIITGSGTKFRDQLTLVGAVADVVVINGVKYGIASIDSDTQITATSVVPALAGVAIQRFNLQNAVSYDMAFAATGEGQSNTKSKSIGHYIRNSGSVQTGEAIILSGQTFIEVPFKLSRTPRKGEIVITNFSGLNGRTTQISNVTATSFRINVNTAAAANYSFGFTITLTEIN